MNSSLNIARIWTSQNDLRNISQISQMIQYVQEGRYFTREELDRFVAIYGGRRRPPLVALTRFPDGKIMAHDGHHRLTSICLGGRTVLRGDEYFIKDFTYPDYTEINLSAGWVTPFDPLVEIRLCEFAPFKREVARLQVDRPDEVENYIRQNKNLYCSERDVRYITDLAGRIQGRMSEDVSSRHGSDYCLVERW